MVNGSWSFKGFFRNHFWRGSFGSTEAPLGLLDGAIFMVNQPEVFIYDPAICILRLTLSLMLCLDNKSFIIKSQQKNYIIQSYMACFARQMNLGI